MRHGSLAAASFPPSLRPCVLLDGSVTHERGDSDSCVWLEDRGRLKREILSVKGTSLLFGFELRPGVSCGRFDVMYGNLVYTQLLFTSLAGTPIGVCV